jgi:hypothetical protein
MSILNSCSAAVQKMIAIFTGSPPGPEEASPAPAAPENTGEPETQPEEPAQEGKPDTEALARAVAERNRKNTNTFRLMEVIENARH